MSWWVPKNLMTPVCTFLELLLAKECSMGVQARFLFFFSVKVDVFFCECGWRKISLMTVGGGATATCRKGKSHEVSQRADTTMRLVGKQEKKRWGEIFPEDVQDREPDCLKQGAEKHPGRTPVLIQGF